MTIAHQRVGAAPDTERSTSMLDLTVGKLDFLFARHPRPMWVFDLETLQFLAVNDAAVELYGHAREQFLASTLALIRPADGARELEAAAEAARSTTENRRSGPHRHVRADGTEFFVRVESAYVEFEGRPARLTMILDQTETMAHMRTLHERESQLALVVDQLPAIMWTTDHDLVLTSVVGAALKSMDLDGNAAVGQNVTLLFTLDSAGRPSRVPAAHAAALLGERVRFGGWWRDRYFDATVEPIRTGDVVTGVIGVALDITEQYESQLALERRNSELDAAQAIAHCGSWSMDLRSGTVYWSPELYRIVGEQPDDPAVERTLFTYDHPDDAEGVRAAIEAAERTREPYNVEHRLVRRDGAVRMVREQGAFYFDDDGHAVRCVGTVLDVTERREAEERMAYLAHHDPLTDLPNRTLLQERLERAVVHAERRTASCAVLFLDLDRFKYINDTFGHVVGDELLVAVAQRIAGVVRAGDTVARPGGDEIVVVLEDLVDSDRASELAQRIRREFMRPFELSVGPQFIAASIGIALYPHDAVTPDDLLRAADAAMYRAKERGGNDFQFFTPQLHETAMKQLAIGNALRVAIEKQELSVAYQPIVNVKDGRTVGVEALARWYRDGEVVAGPAEFVRVAEETGIIRELGETILRQSCERMGRWLKAGLHIDSLSVNISPRQLSERGFVSRLAEILIAAQVAPHRLELEITESAFVDTNDEAFAAITQLRQLGVRFAIDDFGTGYSSLSYLKRIPADTVKIDRSFIVDIHEPTDRTIVEAVVNVARNLGKRVVAEGIETREQVDALRALGCECAQGYLFSRPLEASRFESFIRASA
jgi:diguanylate cyclase (GGDEF)-like protein/PAS domain S-box-containing protein